MRASLSLLLVPAFLLAACGSDDPALNQTAATAQQAYQRGFQAIGDGDWLKAEQYLTQAKQAFPNDPYVILNLGVVAQRLGRFAEARRYYQQVVDMAPDVIPAQVSDPKAAGKSLADLARDDLATLPPE